MRNGVEIGAVPFRRDRISIVKECSFGVFCVLFGLAVLVGHHRLNTRERVFTLDEFLPPAYTAPTSTDSQSREPRVINNTWVNTYTQDPETIRYFGSMSSSNHRKVTGRDLNEGQVELLPNVQGTSIVLEFAPRAGQFTPEVGAEFYHKVIRRDNLWSAKEFNAGLEDMRFTDRSGNRTDYAGNQRNAGLEVGDGQYRRVWQRE